MHNQELAEIDASLQAIVRRAYNLGRSAALKQVVDVLSADRVVGEQLALMAPEEPLPRNHEDAHSPEERSAKTPWWAWPVR